MSKNALETLFESRTRLKMLKFLFRNLGRGYTLNEIVNHTQEDSSVVRKELQKLMEIGLLVQNPRYANKEKTKTIQA